MVEKTIFQNPIFTRFILPFVLIVSLVYALLEKTKLLGEDKHQINAIIAFSIGLLFVAFLYPTLVVQNMILFLSVALVVLFVILLLWGFVFGEKEGFEVKGWMKAFLGGIIGIASIYAVLWATGYKDKIVNALFKQSWSSTFWTNFLFVIVVVIALILILVGKKSKG